MADNQFNPSPEDLKRIEDYFKAINMDAATFSKRMADVKNNQKEFNRELENAVKHFADLNNEFDNISSTFRNVVNDLRKFDDTSGRINKNFKTLGGYADKLKYDAEGIVELNKKDLISLKSKVDVEVKELKTNKERLDNLGYAQHSEEELLALSKLTGSERNKQIAKEAAQYIELRSIFDENNKFREDENNYVKKLLDLLDERLEKEKKYERTAGGILSNLLGGLKKIPIIGDVLDIDSAQKAMKKVALAGGDFTKQMKAGAGELGASIEAAMGPFGLILVAVKAIKALVEMMFVADKQITSIAKNLSISKNEAQGMRDYFITISNTIDTTYNRLQDVIDAQLQLSQLSQFTILYSKTALENQIALTKELGLSEEEAAKLNKNFILNNVEGSKGRRIVYDQIAAFANQNKMVANGAKILQEVSRVSGQILLNFRGNLPALTNAVLEANKLGLSLEQSRDISNSLLDFESSINNELEASVFLGRRFNLDRAKALALEKDYVGATEEVLKQVGSIEEFERMSAIHQQVIAKAAGMTVDQLADSLMYQKFIGTETGKTIQRFKEAGREDLANRIMNGKLVGEELEAAQRSLDAQEKFNLALDKAKEIFTNLVTGGTLDTLAVALKNIANYVAAITGTPIKAAETDILTNKATELQQNIAKTPTGVEKEVKIKEFNDLKQTLTETSKGISDVEEGMNILGDAAEWAFTNLITLGKGTGNIIDKSNKRLEDASKAAIQAKKTLDELNNPTTQKVEDGVSFSDDGPFEIKNKFGQTAVTAIGDKLAVSPNISVVDQPITPTTDFAPMIKTSTPTLDLTPFINAFTSFKNEVITAMNRPQPSPQFALSIDGKQIGTAVGRQTETGTAQNISTGYTMP
jgi:hypothetical protein